MLSSGSGTGDGERSRVLRYLFEDLALDTDRRELRRGPALVAIEPQVFDLLVHLISTSGPCGQQRRTAGLYLAWARRFGIRFVQPDQCGAKCDRR